MSAPNTYRQKLVNKHVKKQEQQPQQRAAAAAVVVEDTLQAALLFHELDYMHASELIVARAIEHALEVELQSVIIAEDIVWDVLDHVLHHVIASPAMLTLLVSAPSVSRYQASLVATITTMPQQVNTPVYYDDYYDSSDSDWG